MPRIPDFTDDEYYHIYNRGVDKRTIFHNAKDKNRFQQMLYLCNGSKDITFRDIQRQLRVGTLKNIFDFERGNQLVAIGAYCIMGNHFHMLIKCLDEQGIGKFMKKLCTGYSMYYNLINESTGRLFESSFRFKHVNT